jgi:hypothetical protein
MAAHRRCGNADSAPNAGLDRSFLRSPVYDCWRVESAPVLKASAAAPTGLLVVENQFDHALLLVDPVAKREIARVVGESTGVRPHLPKMDGWPTCPFTATLPLGSVALTETRLTLSICRRESLQGAWTWVHGC